MPRYWVLLEEFHGVAEMLAKVEEYVRQALSIQERLAPGSLAVAASLNRLGLVAYTRGDFGKAEEYYRQACAIRERLAPFEALPILSLNE